MPDERHYYVICDDNCKFEGMTKEQIFAAIAEATGETPTHIDDAFITKIKEKNANNPLSFWIGTTAEYNAIENKSPNCFYILTDDTDEDDIDAVIEGFQGTLDEFGENLENTDVEVSLYPNVNTNIVAANATKHNATNMYTLNAIFELLADFENNKGKSICKVHATNDENYDYIPLNAVVRKVDDPYGWPIIIPAYLSKPNGHDGLSVIVKNTLGETIATGSKIYVFGMWKAE